MNLMRNSALWTFIDKTSPFSLSVQPLIGSPSATGTAWRLITAANTQSASVVHQIVVLHYTRQHGQLDLIKPPGAARRYAACHRVYALVIVTMEPLSKELCGSTHMHEI